MSQQELRLECLRLVLSYFDGNAERAVEIAKAFYDFVSAYEKQQAS